MDWTRITGWLGTSTWDWLDTRLAMFVVVALVVVIVGGNVAWFIAKLIPSSRIRVKAGSKDNTGDVVSRTRSVEMIIRDNVRELSSLRTFDKTSFETRLSQIAVQICDLFPENVVAPVAASDPVPEKEPVKEEAKGRGDDEGSNRNDTPELPRKRRVWKYRLPNDEVVFTLKDALTGIGAEMPSGRLEFERLPADVRDKLRREEV